VGRAGRRSRPWPHQPTGAGLILVDVEGQLRWASASDQSAQTLEGGQERLAQGPCAVAFSQRLPAAIRNVHTESDWAEFTQVLLGEGIRAALSVPVELDGGVIGTLDICVGQPRDWEPSEVAALQAYAGLVASLLCAANTAEVKGRLADQLQAALEHRWLIEQAKGVVMGREELDAQAAFERLRGAARSSTRRLADVARDVTGGQPCPPTAVTWPEDAPSRPRQRDHHLGCPRVALSASDGCHRLESQLPERRATCWTNLTG